MTFITKAPDFALSARKALVKRDIEYETLLINTIEPPIEQLKKDKILLFRQKKRYTLKTQVIVNKKTRKIIRIDSFNGKRYDFRIFKESKTLINANTLIITDTGY